MSWWVRIKYRSPQILHQNKNSRDSKEQHLNFSFPQLGEDWPRVRLCAPLQKDLSSAGGSYRTEVTTIKKPNCFFKKKKLELPYIQPVITQILSPVPVYHIPHPSSGFYLFIYTTRQELPFYIYVQHLAKQNWALAPAGNCKHYWNTSDDLNFGA